MSCKQLCSNEWLVLWILAVFPTLSGPNPVRFFALGANLLIDLRNGRFLRFQPKIQRNYFPFERNG